MKKRTLVWGIFAALVLIGILAGFAWAAETGKININTATAEELAAGLKNVGPTYAQRIVSYREKNGPFKGPDEIMNVKGIGQKTYELNKAILTVEAPKQAKTE